MAIIEVLNAGFVPLIIALLDGDRYDGGLIKNAYIKGGFVEQITYVLLIMLFGDAVKQITKPWYLSEKRKRLFCLKRDPETGRVTNMTQAELNQQYTKLAFNP